MSAAAFLAARGWAPHAYGPERWSVEVPVRRRLTVELMVSRREMERLARDLGWQDG